MISRLLRMFVLLLVMTAAAIPASSMIVESGETIVIDSTTDQDIYVVAGTVIINAPLHGDLIAAGGKIYINDSVNNVLLAGGTVMLNGYVKGKLRCLGGTLHISRNIAGDLAAAGGEIVIEKNTILSGDLLIAGGKLTVYGAVDGLIRTTSGKFYLYGSAGRGLDCRGGEILLDGKVSGPVQLAASDHLTIGSLASFDGPVRYWAPSPVDFAASCKSGYAIFDPALAIRQTRWYFLGYISWLSFLLYLASALLVIIALQFLLPRLFRSAGDVAYDKPLRSLGIGFLFFAGTPVAIVLGFISIVAIPIGAALLLGYMFTLLICGSITALVAAHWLANLTGIEDSFWKHIWIAFGFYIGLKLLFSIPLFGWILFPLLACIASGALLSSLRRRPASIGDPQAGPGPGTHTRR